MTLASAGHAPAPALGAGFRTAARSWTRAAATWWLARWSRTALAETAGIPIEPGERVLTFDRAPTGALVAATAAAVYVGGQCGPRRAWRRLGWEEVTRAGWDDRRRALVLTGPGPGGMWREELLLDRQSTLVDLARERVSATLLASAVVRQGDQICALVMARLRPGSGKVIWVTLVNGAGDQVIRARAAAVIADLQAQMGIPAG
jgi:hypothetical protein